MTFVIATILFPALLVALSLGTGLLIDRAADGVVPGALIVPVGLGGLVVVAELFAWHSATGSLTPFALLLCAIAGFALGLPRLRSLRPNWWLIAAAVGSYVAVCAPVLLSGRVTMAGYLLDTTVGFHLLGSDYLLDHGRDFGQLPVGTYRTTLEAYFGTQYPSGGHTLLGGAGRLVGTDRIWLYQPFLSLLVACCVPTLYWIARKASLSRPLAAGGAMLAAMPALVYSYAEMGAIKEMTALPFVLLLGAVLVLLPRLIALGLRGAIVPGVVAAAGIGAIGFAFAPWLGLTGVAGLGLLLFESRDRRALVRPLLAWTGVLAVAIVLLALPTFGQLSDSLTLTKSFSTSNAAAVADPGNLLRPLKREQMLGIWLTGSHRVDPGTWFQETYLLIGMALIAALLGLVFLVRRRLWALAAWVVVSGIVWALLTKRGTAWTDAKLLVAHLARGGAPRAVRGGEPLARPPSGRGDGGGRGARRGHPGLERIHLSRHEPPAEQALLGADRHRAALRRRQVRAPARVRRAGALLAAGPPSGRPWLRLQARKGRSAPRWHARRLRLEPRPRRARAQGGGELPHDRGQAPPRLEPPAGLVRANLQRPLLRRLAQAGRRRARGAHTRGRRSGGRRTRALRRPAPGGVGRGPGREPALRGAPAPRRGEPREGPALGGLG